MREIQQIYNLLRAALTGDKPYLGEEQIEVSQWWRLFRLLQHNQVDAVCCDAVAAAAPLREVLMPWLAESDKAERWHRYQAEVQQDIIDTMARNGIETLVLKGTRTARHYPVPGRRRFGDLDLYFYDRHDEADRVASDILKVVVGNDAHHHTKYNYRGVTVESHYDFLNVHYPPSNRRYEALLKQLSTADGQQATFEVLFLLRHMACHFAANRITLRDLADWTLTCRALQGQVDWTLVQETVDTYGMAPFVDALNGIADKQLSYRPPLQSQGGPDDMESVRRLEHDIVYGGHESADGGRDGMARLRWKLRRWKATAWKRQMAFGDNKTLLFLASLTSHAEKPQSILHKM